mmetsp:Transcript_9067/g.24354  ORF Transcript_9067/g.24354 Transcript_9067/m.24354 type:complete len:398 (-) Transcript_9067:2057-3250(-)
MQYSVVLATVILYFVNVVERRDFRRRRCRGLLLLCCCRRLVAAVVDAVVEHVFFPRIQHVEDGTLGLTETRTKRRSELFQFGSFAGEKHPLVQLRASLVGFHQNHLHHVHRHLEERPLAVHGRNCVEIAERFERLAYAKPDGEMKSRLRPRENPRNGSQAFNASIRLASTRSTSNVHPPKLELRCHLLEERNEQRVLEYHTTVRRAAPLAQRVHHLTPLRLGLTRRRKRMLEDRGCVHVKGAKCKLRASKVLLDHLSLNGETKAAIDRLGRLAENGEVRGASAAAYGATASVEQCQLHAVSLRHLRELLLPFVQPPSRRESSSIFPTVAVANHDLLRACKVRANVSVVHRIGVECFHHRWRALKVVKLLKQRHDAHRLAVRPADARLTLEQHHSEHI